jgi:endonuclease G
MSRPYSIADIWFAGLIPVWGTEGIARLANADTHHYTNSCPQVRSFNDMTWGDLEDWILSQERSRIGVISFVFDGGCRDARKAIALRVGICPLARTKVPLSFS